MSAMLETELKVVLSFPAFLILELLAHEPLLFCEIWMDFVEPSTRWVMMTCGVVVPRVLIKINPLPAVASIGVRPTVEDAGRVLLETHIFDFNQAVYGKVIRVEFIEKLRDEAKYPDLASLQQAIHQDAQKAINYFKNASNV